MTVLKRNPLDEKHQSVVASVKTNDAEGYGDLVNGVGSDDVVANADGKVNVGDHKDFHYDYENRMYIKGS